MSSDITLAFAHPAERAAATKSNSDDVPRDRISLRDYIAEVEIGAFQAERGTLQRLKFNVVVEVAPVGRAIDDDVDRILSYDRVTEAIDAELNADRLNLLETLAAKVAERILLEPQALRVFVRIEKIDRGPYSLGVEIVRERGANVAGSAVQLREALRPRIVYLSNDTLASHDLTARIDALASDEYPLVFCVDLPDQAVPRSDSPAAQWRIDVLAIEQNAWVLAGCDARCVVVGTRTELDWAMRNGQICVWAPGKMVFDAADPPVLPEGNASGAASVLAAWFAEQMQALELVVIGLDAPDCNVPVRVI